MTEVVRCAFGCRYDFLAYMSDATHEGARLIVLQYESPADALEAVRSGDVDASDMSLALHAAVIANTDSRELVGFPTFLLRTFRHGNLYVRDDSPLVEPRELEGRRIATLDYGISMAVWLRGCLSDQYGVDWSGVTWFTTREPAAEEVRPPGLKTERLGGGRTVWQALEDGTVDAVIGAPPHGLPIRHLIGDWRSAALAYYQQWAAYPIMHSMVVRHEALDRWPWLPGYLSSHIDSARETVLEQYDQTSGAILSLPLVDQLMGADSELDFRWLSRSGLMENRVSLEVFLRYMYQQGMLRRPIGVESLFESSSTAA